MPLTDEPRLLAAQAEILTAHETEPANPQYNCAGYLDLYGTLRPDLFAQAVAIVDGECEALRLRLDFETHRGFDELSVRLAMQGHNRLETIDSPESAALAWMHDDIATPLRLGTDRLARFALFRVAPDRHLFYLRYHHLLLDGFGQVVYLRRLARVYSALCVGQQLPLCLFGGLDDLVDEASAYVASPAWRVDREYWLTRMSNPPEPIDLGAVPSRQAGLLNTDPRAGTSMRALRSAAAARNTHWSVVVIAALVAYLHRLTGRDDLVIGFPARSRTTSLALLTPAMLANELPLRVRVPDGATLEMLVSRVDVAIRELLRHQRFRGEELYRSLRAAHPDAERPSVVVNLIQGDGPMTFGDCTGVVCQLAVGPVRGLSFDFLSEAHNDILGLEVRATPSALRADVEGHRNRLSALLETLLGDEKAMAVPVVRLRFPGHGAE